MAHTHTMHKVRGGGHTLTSPTCSQCTAVDISPAHSGDSHMTRPHTTQHTVTRGRVTRIVQLLTRGNNAAACLLRAFASLESSPPKMAVCRSTENLEREEVQEASIHGPIGQYAVVCFHGACLNRSTYQLRMSDIHTPLHALVRITDEEYCVE